MCNKNSKLIIRSLFLIGIILFFSSCINHKNLFRYDLNTSETKNRITGVIKQNTKSNKPYNLILLKTDKYKKDKLVDFSIHQEDGLFNFIIPNGTYKVLAIQEPHVLSEKQYVHHFISNEITFSKGNELKNITITLSSTPIHIEKETLLIATLKKRNIYENLSIGDITSLKNPIFNRSNAKVGLWKPKEFLNNKKAGVYVLNDYSSDKLPLLFIHGINGTPLDFNKIIANVNKNKHQVFVYYYPSGINLNYSVDILSFIFKKLQDNLDLTSINVVAHSMGGLIARGFINNNKEYFSFPNFISISTPWNGQKYAQLGGKNVGQIIPSFGNMYPGSNYQKKIRNTSLPENTKHYLLFGYKGKASFILENSNDGIISLSSQLFDEIQKDSYKIYGFNKNHKNILTDDNLIQIVNTAIEY